MAEHQATIEVGAPVDRTFTYLTDLTNLPTWDSSVRAVSLAEDPGSPLGRRFDVTVGFYGKRLEATYEIVAHEPSTMLEWSINGKAVGRTRIELHETAGGTRIDYRLDVRLRGVARLLDRGLGLALAGIGENVERGLQDALGH